MIHVGVIGWPIKHSRSPLIHGHWLGLHGIAGSYERLPVAPEQLASFVGGLAHPESHDRGLSGCNVTLPHKEQVLALIEPACIHPSAAAIGAANTLWREGGKVFAANTDTEGFMAHLAAEHPQWTSRAGTVLVLGAGGAARAIVFGLMQAGRDVVVANRTHARALVLVAAGRSWGSGSLRAVAWEDMPAALAKAALVVNTTSQGMAGQPQLEIDLSVCRADAIIADIVYVPLETPLLRQAQARGLATLDGLGMLLHQAVPGFEQWFGVRPRVTSTLRSLIEADLEAS